MQHFELGGHMPGAEEWSLGLKIRQRIFLVACIDLGLCCSIRFFFVAYVIFSVESPAGEIIAISCDELTKKKCASETGGIVKLVALRNT